MLLRRCAVLFCEPREHLGLDLSALFSGSGALGATMRWFVLAPHAGPEIEIDAAQLAVLDVVGPSLWVERDGLDQRFGAPLIESLLANGLLIGDREADAALRARDDTLRAMHWWPLAAVIHSYSRWEDVKGEKGRQFPTFNDMVERYGPPPSSAISVGTPELAIALPAPQPGPLDAVLLGRYTGRNFDPAAALTLDQATRLLQRTFGAQQVRTMMPGATAFKKTSPSGGGLHPIEAYVLAQRVDGVACGLYHYHPLHHTLEPMRALDADQARALALVAVADQDWFADAPMLVVLAARVERTFWKYRQHVKSYRVLTLDAGHLSQTFYLLAAEAGMPGFITAGINETNIERAFGFDPLRDAVLAVLGCGVAAATSTVTEMRYD